MSDVLNPVDLEQQIQDVKNTIHRGVEVFKEKHDAYLKAETAYEYTRSQAFLDFDGPQTEKRHYAVVEAHEARQRRDDAQVQYEYTRRKLEAFTAELMALQNLNKGVRAMYNAERGWGG